jgi:hypothetical protein
MRDRDGASSVEGTSSVARCGGRTLALTLMALVLLGAGEGSARANEVCGGVDASFGSTLDAGHICLLSPPSPAAPLGPLPTFQLRVPADVNRIDTRWRGFDFSPYFYLDAAMQLVAQGPPGGSSIWQGTITPQPFPGLISVPRDGTLSIEVTTFADSPDEKTTFADLPVLGLVTGGALTVKRQQQRYVATYVTTVRGPATAKIETYISASKEGNISFPGKIITNRASGAGGAVQATAWFPRSRVLRKCKAFTHCTIWADAQLTAPGLQEIQSVGFTRLKVK